MADSTSFCRFLSLLLLLQYRIIISEGTLCLQCNSIPFTEDLSSCTKEVICPGSQICFVSLAINGTGQANYKTGCINQTLCAQNGVVDPGLIGKREVAICRHCCTGDRCNSHPCQTTPVAEQCSDWEKWTNCDLTCGGGRQTRARMCKQENRQSKLYDTRNCNTQACPTVTAVCTDTIDDCASPVIKQTMCTNEDYAPKYCQKTCDRCPVDGQWSDWSQWSACTSSCGNNAHRVRLRVCNNPAPSNNGSNCAGGSLERVDCNKACPVDGAWSSWTASSPCSVSCEKGAMSMARTCTSPQPAFGGKNCEGDPVKATICDMGQCPIDGAWSTWTVWSLCSATCGNGVQSRHRTCDHPVPLYGGGPCNGSPKETNGCRDSFCAVDGQWADWSPWHQCSVTCGGGTMFRSRTCSNPYPQHGGKGCENPATYIEKTTCAQTSCADIDPASATPLKATTMTSTMMSSIMTSSVPPLVPSTGCTDQSFCTDSHIAPLVCQDVYVANTYCPKLCGICGAPSSPPPCVDSVGGKCNDQLYLQFACTDNELAALCAKSCGVCH